MSLIYKFKYLKKIFHEYSLYTDLGNLTRKRKRRNSQEEVPDLTTPGDYDFELEISPSNDQLAEDPFKEIDIEKQLALEDKVCGATL